MLNNPEIANEEKPINLDTHLDRCFRSLGGGSHRFDGEVACKWTVFRQGDFGVLPTASAAASSSS
jgi:hypothetical protein